LPGGHKTDEISRAGVHAAGLAVEDELGWIFREQPTSDNGIDAHIEVRDPQSQPSGRLIALQIKTGARYFREKTTSAYVYRGDIKHLDYWRRHCLPVLVVLVDLKAGETYWQIVVDEFVRRTKKHWKMEVPFNQHLDKSARKALRRIAEGSPAQIRLNELVLAKPWMDKLARGDRLFLEAEEWINKTSGRGSLRLLAQDSNGNDTTVRDWPFVMFPGMLYVEVLPALFSWADLSIDDEFYEKYDRDQYDLECGAWDNEDHRYILYTEDYGDWRSQFASIRPYECDGEVAKFRLELQLNKVGKAFLDIEDYLLRGSTSVPDLRGSMGNGYFAGLKALARKHRIMPDVPEPSDE
jgi:hypothetical protein